VSKLMPFVGMIVSGIVAILFVADLAAGFPFQRKSIPADIGFIVSSSILAYMSWTTMERARR
jgi:hypothetical protein